MSPVWGEWEREQFSSWLLPRLCYCCVASLGFLFSTVSLVKVGFSVLSSLNSDMPLILCAWACHTPGGCIRPGTLCHSKRVSAFHSEAEGLKGENEWGATDLAVCALPGSQDSFTFDSRGILTIHFGQNRLWLWVPPISFRGELQDGVFWFPGKPSATSKYTKLPSTSLCVPYILAGEASPK